MATDETDDKPAADERSWLSKFMDRGDWAKHMNPGPREYKETFWPGVKHDPNDAEDKDWANSEPDPNAP